MLFVVTTVFHDIVDSGGPNSRVAVEHSCKGNASSMPASEAQQKSMHAHHRLLLVCLQALLLCFTCWCI
jgi:hypothetical protein